MHARYAEFVAKFDIDTLQIVKGSLPRTASPRGKGLGGNET
jgi:hypothetical protein